MAPSSADAFPLVDHHVHSVRRDVPDRGTFERFLSESPEPAEDGCSFFDSFLGAAVLSVCGPLLGLDASTTAEEYVARRTELGGEEANRRLLRAAEVDTMLVDHGYRGAELVDIPELAELAGCKARRIVRLEQVAEAVAEEGAGADDFASVFAERLAAECAGPDAAVGCKSVLAYRYGLDVDPREPRPDEVRSAAEEWLSGRHGASPPPVTHPVLLRHLVWAGLRTRLPLQFHTGYGDPDLELHRSNPSLLTGLIRAADPLGTPIMLLHCYPYHREAAYLAGVYPHVYFDVGLAVNYVGHRVDDVLAEAIESAPFHTMMYSSDAFGLAELHALAAIRFRQALARVLQPLVDQESRSAAEVAQAAELIGAGNARRVYHLGSDG